MKTLGFINLVLMLFCLVVATHKFSIREPESGYFALLLGLWMGVLAYVTFNLKKTS